MDLELSPEEAQLLVHVLKDIYLPNFREEIGKTENADWRADMKKDEARLNGVLQRLQAAATAPRRA